jgi:hypothetical protein
MTSSSLFACLDRWPPLRFAEVLFGFMFGVADMAKESNCQNKPEVVMAFRQGQAGLTNADDPCSRQVRLGAHQAETSQAQARHGCEDVVVAQHRTHTCRYHCCKDTHSVPHDPDRSPLASCMNGRPKLPWLNRRYRDI